MELPKCYMTLRRFIDKHGLSEKMSRDFMRQIVNAAKHCIYHNVLHSYLNMGNLVINLQTLELQLFDCGQAELVSTRGQIQTQPFVWHISSSRCFRMTTLIYLKNAAT